MNRLLLSAGEALEDVPVRHPCIPADRDGGEPSQQTPHHGNLWRVDTTPLLSRTVNLKSSA